MGQPKKGCNAVHEELRKICSQYRKYNHIQLTLEQIRGLGAPILHKLKIGQPSISEVPHPRIQPTAVLTIGKNPRISGLA